MMRAELRASFPAGMPCLLKVHGTAHRASAHACMACNESPAPPLTALLMQRCKGLAPPSNASHRSGTCLPAGMRCLLRYVPCVDPGSSRKAAPSRARNWMTACSLQAYRQGRETVSGMPAHLEQAGQPRLWWRQARAQRRRARQWSTATEGSTAGERSAAAEGSTAAVSAAQQVSEAQRL